MHIDSTVKKCFGFVNVMRSLCGVTWGSDTNCLILLYLGFIRPKLEYMAPLLLNCDPKIFIKLERVQYKCLRIALGAMQSTHTLSLEQTANVMPLRERLAFLSDCIINKILSREHHPARPYIMELITFQNISVFFSNFNAKLRQQNIICSSVHPMFEVPFDSLHYRAVVKHLPVKKTSCTPAVVNQKFNDLLNSSFKNFLRIYTDGSKTTSGVGCGVWMPDINAEAYFSLNSNSSIFTAEIREI